MATTAEISRRVEDADAARSAKRSAAARQVGELAQRRAAIAEQLEDIERELGDVLASAREVMDVVELARFTDVPAADLMRWHEARKATKRKRPTARARDTSRRPSAARTPTAGRASTLPQPRGGADAPARVAAEVT